MATGETVTTASTPEVSDITGIDSEIQALQNQMRTTAPGSPQERELYDSIRAKQGLKEDARRSVVQASLEARDDLHLKPQDARAVAHEAQEFVDEITQEHQILPGAAPHDIPGTNGAPEPRQ